MQEVVWLYTNRRKTFYHALYVFFNISTFLALKNFVQRCFTFMKWNLLYRSVEWQALSRWRWTISAETIDDAGTRHSCTRDDVAAGVVVLVQVSRRRRERLRNPSTGCRPGTETGPQSPTVASETQSYWQTAPKRLVYFEAFNIIMKFDVKDSFNFLGIAP